jgi:hypothetical protein
VDVVVALLVVLILAVSGYLAGRLHGQLGYRSGYRSGYRHGYVDGDGSGWHQRRRDLQASIAAGLRPGAGAVGTTYTGGSWEQVDINGREDPAAGGTLRNWALIDSGRAR